MSAEKEDDISLRRREAKSRVAIPPPIISEKGNESVYMHVTLLFIKTTGMLQSGEL